MRPVGVWLLAAALLLGGTSALASLRLALNGAALSNSERQASQALLDEAYSALPPRVIEQLDRRVEISWSIDLPANAYGRAIRHDALVLNAKLLPALVDGSAASQKTNRPHGSVRRELLATVLHELTHLYDRARLWPAAEKTLLQRCRQQASSLGKVGLPDNCRGQTERRFTLSDEPRLLDLAGWAQYVGRRGEREQSNRQVARSPDSYELSNPREFVAVNMEYFLLDPAYACRRPALYRYFRAHFDWAPSTAQPCAPAYVYLNAGRDFAPSRSANSTRSASMPSTSCWPKPMTNGSAVGATACCAWSSARRAARVGRTVGWIWIGTWCCPTAPSSAMCNCPVGML